MIAWIYRHITVIVLALVMTWWAALRLYGIDIPSLWMDEAFSYALISAIREHGYPLLSNGDINTRAQIVHSLYALFAWIPIDSVTLFRAISGIAGVGVLMLSYILFRHMSGERVALAVVAALAFLQWEIDWSRQIRMYIFLQGFMLAGVIFLERFMDRARFFDATGLAVAVLLCVNTHPAGAFLVLYSAIRIAISPYLADFARIMKNFRSPGNLAILVLVLVFAGYTAWSLVPQVFSNISLTPPPSSYLAGYTQILWERLWWIFPLSLVGIVVLFFQNRGRAIAFSATIAIYMLYLAFANDVFAERYIFLLVPFLVWLGIMPIVTGIHRVLDSERGWRWIATIAVLLFLISTGAYQLSPRAYSVIGDTAPQSDMRSALQTIEVVRSHPRIATHLPIFLQIYLPQADRYYIPFRFDGRARSTPESAPYAQAQTIESVDALRAVDYVILDDFWFRMLADSSIRSYLRRQKVTVIEPPVAWWENVMIWRIGE